MPSLEFLKTASPLLIALITLAGVLGAATITSFITYLTTSKTIQASVRASMRQEQREELDRCEERCRGLELKTAEQDRRSEGQDRRINRLIALILNIARETKYEIPDDILDHL